jgi:hypothetical protein
MSERKRHHSEARMKRIVVFLPLIFCLLVNVAEALTYFVCYKPVLTPEDGLDVGCVKCSSVQPSPDPDDDNPSRVCPNGLGKDFTRLDMAIDWRKQNCGCPKKTVPPRNLPRVP